ncbi:hypothetical protein SDRG_09669 [Saprolegnia diclina VS20]|uniref:Uncharacterized protein n=1 Tax=Saprolegnia diclina (strain VS20) TaxID=1156394 RepID=T0QGD9_SAPDV|nr:hypothetical protein SDRG_09669 [Saprolegnia diclina VS20]EQC32695.1 hypothetical protein SDRG_09669 [Saprolegnia diclina VS20]|eukprot:XP_008613839.1 hypothetical protein SDRG_09669 [Saprolegnia diclina VS20]
MGGKKPLNMQNTRGTWSSSPSHHTFSASNLAMSDYAGPFHQATGLYDVGLLDLGHQPPPPPSTPGGPSLMHGVIGSTRPPLGFERADLFANDMIDAKVSELVEAIGSSMRRQLKPIAQAQGVTGACNCSDEVSELRQMVLDMQRQIQTLSSQQTADKSASPKESKEASVAAVMDRVSTLEGRQSAFQSQMAQLCKSLGTVPTGKNSSGKAGGIALPKPLLQELRDEFDTKLNAATLKLETAMNKQISVAMASTEQHIAQDMDGRFKSMTSMQYDDILSLVSSETDICLQNTKQWLEDKVAQEAKHRMALEARMNQQFENHVEWLQQLESVGGNWHGTSPPYQEQIDKLATHVQQLQANVVANASTKKGDKTAGLTQAQVKQILHDMKAVTEQLALLDMACAKSSEASEESKKKVVGLQKLIEKMMRDQGSVEQLLQQYVSTITHQVASVTRQYVSVRIRDNNRLLDATLRARIPAYVENETESFMLVRPTSTPSSPPERLGLADGAPGLVLRDDGAAINEMLLDNVLKMDLPAPAPAPTKQP